MEHLKIEYLPVIALEEYANNTRKHTEEDVEQIMHSIERFGFSDPIGIWSDHNGRTRKTHGSKASRNDRGTMYQT